MTALRSVLTLSLLSAFGLGATPAGCQDPPEFPEGENFVATPFVFSFSSAPYVMTMQQMTVGDGTGGYRGTYHWNFWYTKASLNAGNPPECVFSEDVVATVHKVGSDPDVNYDTCQSCSSFWQTVQTYAESSEGCTEDIYNFWYTVDGEEILVYDQLTGYRSTAEAGWPAEYGAIEGQLTLAGYTGTLYDQIAASPGEFFPTYAVAPMTSEHSDLAEFRLQSPAEVRRLVR